MWEKDAADALKQNSAMSWLVDDQLIGGSEVLILAMNIILDVVIFAVSELIVRNFFHSAQYSGRRRNGQLSLLITQEVILLILTFFVLVLHHTPYILILLAIVVLLKALQLKFFTKPELFVTSTAVSKRIKRGPSGPGFQEQIPDTYSQPAQFSGSLPFAGGHRARASSNKSTDTGLRNRLINRGGNVRSPHQSLLKTSSSYSSQCTATDSHVSLGQISSDSQVSLGEKRSMIEPRRPITNSPMHVEEPLNQSVSAIPVSAKGSIAPSTYNLYSLRETSSRVAAAPSSTPPGIFNNGNTCFINSTFQCLTWTPNFIKLLPQTFDERSRESTFLSKLNHVFLLCNSVPDSKSVFRPISTTDLLSSLSLLAPHLVSPANSIQYQQDTAEFLLWLLNHLHGALRTHSNGKSGLVAVITESQLDEMEKIKNACMKRINEVGSANLEALKEPMIKLSGVDWDLHWQKYCSTLYELFLGQILEARECKNCKKVTMNIEYFTLLPLPIPFNCKNTQCITLKDCLNMFSEREELVQDNMISCSCIPGLSLAPATRLALLSIMPKCLIIQLTRFSYDSSLHTAVKNDSPISFPLKMDFFPHTMKAMLSEERQPKIYRLHAFCVHVGAQSTSFGHYMAVCQAADQQWYHFNDQQVTHIDDIDAALNSDFVLHNAYLLFYHFE